jgi:hypothetical protein
MNFSNCFYKMIKPQWALSFYTRTTNNFSLKDLFLFIVPFVNLMAKYSNYQNLQCHFAVFFFHYAFPGQFERQDNPGAAKQLAPDVPAS